MRTIQIPTITAFTSQSGGHWRNSGAYCLPVSPSANLRPQTGNSEQRRNAGGALAGVVQGGTDYWNKKNVGFV